MVGDFFEVSSDSTVNIRGGTVGDFFDTRSRSTVNIRGGTVGEFFEAFFSSTVNISGGAIGGNFDAFRGSTVNISGGTVGDAFDARSGSTVNLVGTEFYLNGIELSDLELFEPFMIADRDVTLTGLLADGNAFEFELNSRFSSNADFFDPGAILTVTLVPEPMTFELLTMACGLLLLNRRRS